MKRDLNTDEKRMCEKSIERFQRERIWAMFDLDIVQLKLDKWDVTKSKMLHNSQSMIKKLQEQARVYQEMIDTDFSETWKELMQDKDQMEHFINNECGKQIQILQDQVDNGVEEVTITKVKEEETTDGRCDNNTSE